MPRLPKKTVTFEGGKRIKLDLDTTYGIPEPLKDPKALHVQLVQETTAFFLDIDNMVANMSEPVACATLQALDEQHVECRRRLDEIKERYSENTNFSCFREEDLRQRYDLGFQEFWNYTLQQKIRDNLHAMSSADRVTSGASIDAEPSIMEKVYTYKMRLENLCGNEELSSDIKSFFHRGNPYENAGKARKNYLARFDDYTKAEIERFEEKVLPRANRAHERDLVDNVTDINEFLEEEQHYKALYLRTLSRMLAEQGYNVSAEQLFKYVYTEGRGVNDEANKGSQTLLFLRDFTQGKQHDALDLYGNPESTTPYAFDFNFAQHKVGGVPASVPAFALDVAAVRQLTGSGVALGTIETWCKNFLTLASVAEHDYLHQLTLPYLDDSRTIFLRPRFARGIINKEGIPSSVMDACIYIEDHALTLHAQIVKRLFDEMPLRKQRVLECAVSGYHQLHLIQEQALSVCNTGEERHNVSEAITYLAEIYTHRLFRVISPQDADLAHVANAMNEVKLVTPEDIQQPVPADNLERLTRHCARQGFTYLDVHTKDNFPMARFDISLNEIGERPREREDDKYSIPKCEEIRYMPALKVMEGINKGAARAFAPNSTEFRKEALSRAHAMREAINLRREGNASAASEIESNLRKPGAYER